MDNPYSKHAVSFSAELQLLLSILGIANAPDLPRQILSRYTNLDWRLFFDLAGHHRVRPLVYSLLSKQKEDLAPQEIIGKLKGEYVKNTFDMLRLTNELERIHQMLELNGIRSMILKGPVLAASIYGDVSLRTSKDLDIWVPFRDLEKVEDLLLKENYQVAQEMRLLYGRKWRDHHISYFNKEKRIEIELHWRLSSDWGNEPGFDELWERRAASSLTSTPLYHPQMEDLFQYLVCHGARHGWFRLRWLSDIEQLLRKQLDWEKIVHNCNKYEQSKLVGQSLILCNRLFHTPIPSELCTLMSKRANQLANDAISFIQDKVNFAAENHTPSQIRRHQKYLSAIQSSRQKWIFWLSRLHPTSWDAATLPLPRSLHFLYFLLRPFLIVWRKRKRHVQAEEL
ncbi:nucleotidyltransferase family protein [Paenibacillus chartarius]|uniref:Nucleotidyltransferase family protein n=1 Tax=Paenibacillus chartarius TaxID=747481 RepID=A0ABV6DKN2_9BACL